MIDTLYWRSRQEGDTIYMGGMTRKLRKLYNQKQIPLRLREQLPLLCDEKGIVWAPFVGARDGLAADDGEWFVCVQVSDTLKE
jgi:tRNA(Ile)-lysidine synthetase-like protein